MQQLHHRYTHQLVTINHTTLTDIQYLAVNNIHIYTINKTRKIILIFITVYLKNINIIFMFQYYDYGLGYLNIYLLNHEVISKHPIDYNCFPYLSFYCIHYKITNIVSNFKAC